MDERELRHRAAEASRLKSEPLLIEALNAILADARDALETCTPEELLRLQANAAAARALASAIERVILQGPEPTVETTPVT